MQLLFLFCTQKAKKNKKKKLNVIRLHAEIFYLFLF